MPFTANKAFKAAPRILASASGMHYRDRDGREILDATAGLWCVNAGHGRPEIADAVGRQLMTLDYTLSFQMGHTLAFETAERLARLAPDPLNHVFFANSGSESVDTALKIALAYQRARGLGHKTRLIGRERGYHGVGFGGISVGGIVSNRRAFSQLLPQVDHLPHTHRLDRNVFSKGQPLHGAELADDLERIVALHGAETIAAVIVEPVAGSTGVLVPPQGYLERLRSICTRHDILLIIDEVITGFGRLGSPFAVDHFGVMPDMICLAKGLTNGVLPMGAVIASDAIHDAIVDTGGDRTIELFHGYTYSGCPAACAAALATLDIHEREELLTRVRSIAEEWQEAVYSLRTARHVIDVRNIGLIAGIELDPRAGAPGARAYDAMVAAFESGLLIRITGDIIALSPPLILSSDDIDRIVTGLRAILTSLE
jgi:beta-alanine--pyruvate transaminase